MAWHKKLLTVLLSMAMLYGFGCGQANPSFLPPLLSDTSGLKNLLSLVPQPLEIQEESKGSFIHDNTFMGHITSLGPKSSLEISLFTSNATGLALYGPRDAQGLFGAALLSTSSNPGHTSISSTELVQGDYLVLLANLDGLDGDYRLMASCQGQCQDAKCPALVCGKYCATGLQLNQQGCPTCDCAPGCAYDSDCPLEFVCTEGVCTKAESQCECDGETYHPVCGLDGQSYANACELDCAGVELASEGTCQDEQCSVDIDCPKGMLCVMAKCVSQCECDDEPIDEQCGTDGLTYLNQCERKCAGVDLAHQGPCNSCNPEICGDFIDNDCDGFVDEGCDDPCSSDADCPAGKVCMGGICAGAISCADDADCPANQICQASTSTCRTQGECSAEICDGLDNDCDGQVDEGCPACRSDADCEESELCIEGICAPECHDEDQDGFMDASCGGQDCDDADPAINPAAEEICDGTDNDCDGQVDEGCEQPCSSDSDCAAGQVCINGTCQAEQCSTNDECAEGEVCVNGHCVAATCDVDGDGYLDSTCDGADCDDNDPTINPAAEEICDGADNDCDGVTDEGCEPSCRTDDECAAGQVCLNNQCTNTCATNIDCPDGWTCNAGSGFCEP